MDTTNANGLPDIQYEIVNFPKKSSPSIFEGLNKFFNYHEFDDLISDANQNHVISGVVVNMNKPKSVGKISLNETFEAKIDLGYLTNEEDVDTLLRGIRYFFKLIKSPAMQILGVEYLRLPLPECDKFPFDSDRYWKCYVRFMTMAGSHQVGTGKMGVDRKSVVDPQLRVYKTRGLRQIDAGM